MPVLHPVGTETKLTVMRTLLLAAVILMGYKMPAQNNTTYSIIEGGKTLVELVRVFKTPRQLQQKAEAPPKVDSCLVKNMADLCIRNSTTNSITVVLLRRNGNGYETGSLSMNISPKSQESLYELRAGIYKMKLEREEDGKKTVLQEGEIKLTACNNFYKEIRN